MRATAAPWLPAARTFLPPPGLALAALLLAAGTPASAQTAPLKVQQVQGRAEVQDGGSWRPVSGGAPVRLGLRTGAGQVWLASGGPGRLLVGPQSRLRVFRGEADLQGGQFLLVGPVAAHLLGHHLVLERGSQARVDLGANGAPRRAALLAGSGRVALGQRVVRLTAGQQVALNTGAVTPYTGGDPWYAAQFRGLGSATVQATRGPAYLSSGGVRQIAKIGSQLQTGQHLITGEGAWAEVGFAGGGYLRLQAGSELNVLDSGRSARGQQVTLQLTHGSAWNVARGSQGESGAPLVGSVLRGSLFQVGVTGLVRLFGTGPLAARTVTPGTGTAPGTAPAASHLNRTLDAELGRPLTLQVDPVPHLLRDLTLSASSLPDARVTARVGTRTFTLTPRSGEAGRFRLAPAASLLPEGTHTVVVRAEWRGQVRTQTLRVTLDRTPPTLEGVRAESAGSLLLVSGTVRDAETAASRGRLTLTVQLGAESLTRTVTLTGGAGTFRLPLPAPAPGTPVRLSVRDEAGNEAHAAFP